MKQWQRLAGIGSTLLIASVVASTTALGLYVPRISLSNMTMSTSLLSLLISADNEGAPASYNRSLSLTFQPLLADGVEHSIAFWLKNASSEGKKLRVRAKMNPGGQDWEVLRHNIQIRMQASNPIEGTVWRSLAEWESTPINLTAQSMEPGSSRQYRLFYRLPLDYPLDPDGNTGPRQAGDPIGEELAGKTTSGFEIVLEGWPE